MRHQACIDNDLFFKNGIVGLFIMKTNFKKKPNSLIVQLAGCHVFDVLEVCCE